MQFWNYWSKIYVVKGCCRIIAYSHEITNSYNDEKMPFVAIKTLEKVSLHLPLCWSYDEEFALCFFKEIPPLSTDSRKFLFNRMSNRGVLRYYPNIVLRRWGFAGSILVQSMDSSETYSSRTRTTSSTRQSVIALLELHFGGDFLEQILAVHLQWLQK